MRMVLLLGFTKVILMINIPLESHLIAQSRVCGAMSAFQRMEKKKMDLGGDIFVCLQKKKSKIFFRVLFKKDKI